LQYSTNLPISNVGKILTPGIRVAEMKQPG
jgi:hypothetical protein